MFRFATLSLLAAASLSSALSIPRSASMLEERNLLNLDLNANVLQPGHGLLDTDLTASVLKNGKTGSSLVDLDSKVGVLTGNRHGSNLLDVDADATVGKNGKTGSSLLDADVDATVGHVSKTGSSLLDATVNADVLKNGKTGKSLLGADVDATVLSTKRGLLDATATVTSGAASVAGLSVLSGKSALIDVDVLGTILGPQQCTGNAVIGVQAEVTVGNLLHVCACVEILSLGSNQKACPTCPANADPLCGSGQCGCKCRDGFFASVSHGCLPIHTCTSSGGRLSRHSDGTSSCECSSPYVSNNEGSCHLPASARARRSRKATLMTREGDAAKCPNGERACPTGSNGGYECLDVMNSLESCGGCPGEKSAVNCQTIAGAKSASCSAGVCEISSCFPGFLYKNGRCVRSKRA